MGRSHYRRHVPEGICGRHPMDSSRHRRHGMDGRSEALDRERPVRHCPAQPGGIRKELRMNHRLPIFRRAWMEVTEGVIRTSLWLSFSSRALRESEVVAII